MTQVIDAPYIREAELIGMPPYDEVDLEPVRSSMGNAHFHIGQAVSYLCAAADGCEGTEYEKKIVELIERLEDLQSDVNLQREKMRR